MVTHHVESVLDPESDIDQVVVLQGGQVAEVGSPPELMRRSAGAFKKLIDLERDGET